MPFTHLKVKLIELIFCAWSGPFIVVDSTVFEAASHKVPAICIRLRIGIVFNGNTDALNNLVTVTGATLFSLALNKDGS